MAEFPAWLCLTIRETFGGGSRKAAEDLVCSIVGDFAIESRFVGDGQLDGTGEYYLLLKCSGWDMDIQHRLEKTGAVADIAKGLGEFPVMMGDKEVSKFILSSLPEECSEVFVGDVVFDSEGPFENLHGIVVGKTARYCEVLFSLYMKRIRVKIPLKRVYRMCNMFERIKVPLLGGGL